MDYCSREAQGDRTARCRHERRHWNRCGAHPVDHATRGWDVGLADVYSAVQQAIVKNARVVHPVDATTVAVALRSNLSDELMLGDPERALLTEWLDRIADHSGKSQTE